MDMHIYIYTDIDIDADIRLPLPRALFSHGLASASCFSRSAFSLGSCSRPGDPKRHFCNPSRPVIKMCSLISPYGCIVINIEKNPLGEVREVLSAGHPNRGSISLVLSLCSGPHGRIDEQRPSSEAFAVVSAAGISTTYLVSHLHPFMDTLVAFVMCTVGPTPAKLH